MPDPKLFIPDEALIFRSLPEQFRGIRELRRQFENYRARGHASRTALYFAFVMTFPNKHGVTTAVGADEFYRQMTELLRSAQDMVEHVTDRYFRPFAQRLASHNTIANCLDPIQMLIMATETLPKGASHINRRRHFEAGRQLAIALQLFSIESVDEEAWVAQDLSQIDQLSWERLFLQRESQDIWVLSELHTDPAQAGRTKSIHVFSHEKNYKRALKRLQKSGVPIKEELLFCRVTLIEDTRYFIYAINRRKRLLSTLMKLERGRRSTDRRGWKYVVVAVQTETGVRLADRHDAIAFSAHTLTHLWQDPLRIERDTSPPNPNRHETYWDQKVIGRFLHKDNGRVVAGAAEQLVTCIADHLDANIATDHVNHMLYRSQQILDSIAPLWFPHRRGPYRQVRSFRLPGYGVDWDDKQDRTQLQRWWQSQL